MAKKKHQTPAQEQRSRIATAIRDRGERAYNIWLVRPPFESHDLVLGSDPQYFAIYVIEGEPTYRDIRYAPEWYNTDDAHRPSRVQPELATVTTVSGQELMIRLAFGFDAEHAAATDALAPVDGQIRITMRTLDYYLQRIENWRRVIPCIRRVQLHATTALERQVSVALHCSKQTALRDLHQSTGDVDEGLFLGAVAAMLRRRELASDLDTRPWSWRTLVWNAVP